MYRISRKYGIKAGILVVVLSWISFFVTKSLGVVVTQITSIFVILTVLGFIPAAIRSVRQMKGNFITFWQAFFTGAITTIFPAFFMFLSTIIFMALQRTEFAKWSLGSASELQEDMHAVVMHPVEQGVIMFLTVMMLGTMISLLSAVILHRSRVQ